MVMPDNVEIYVPPTGSKIHLQIVCGGQNARKEIITEVDFLERLESGQGCRRCCCSEMMIEIIKKDLKKKEVSRKFLESFEEKL